LDFCASGVVAKKHVAVKERKTKEIARKAVLD